jgi:hypothetical protein
MYASAVRMIPSERSSASSELSPHAAMPWPPRMQTIPCGFATLIAASWTSSSPGMNRFMTLGRRAAAVKRPDPLLDPVVPGVNGGLRRPDDGGGAMARGNASAGAGGGAVYGLGLIGAAIYYFSTGNNFGDFVLAIPKALVWPAIVVYELLKMFYGH